jgi:hypothetical protein
MDGTGFDSRQGYGFFFSAECPFRILFRSVPMNNLNSSTLYSGDRGGTVVKVLCYKSEDRWFDSRWCHWNFSLK